MRFDVSFIFELLFLFTSIQFIVSGVPQYFDRHEFTIDIFETSKNLTISFSQNLNFVHKFVMGLSQALLSQRRTFEIVALVDFRQWQLIRDFDIFPNRKNIRALDLVK